MDTLNSTEQKQVNEVVSFWFEDADSGRLDLPQSRRWFRGGNAIDAAIRSHFHEITEQALEGGLSQWRNDPTSAMALILLLDQFPRHLHRRKARAFAGSELAVSLCRFGLKHNYPAQLPFVWRVFFYLPLQHSENCRDQHHAVTLYEALLESAPAHLSRFADTTLASAREHKLIVDEFGRFPHRNLALGRPSTQTELDYLARSGKRFGQ